MNGFVEQSLAPSLGGLAIARVVFNVRNQSRIENALAIACGIKAAIEVEIGTSQVQPDLLGHVLQSVQARGKESPICLIHRSHGEGGQDIAMGVCDGDDFLPLLVFVARVANPIAPFLATVLVPSPCSTRTSRCFSAERCATLARNACHSDPSSAHFAKTL